MGGLKKSKQTDNFNFNFAFNFAFPKFRILSQLSWRHRVKLVATCIYLGQITFFLINEVYFHMHECTLYFALYLCG